MINNNVARSITLHIFHFIMWVSTDEKFSFSIFQSSDCEPPGPYSVSGHAERPQQKPSDKNDEIFQADV